MDAKFDTATWAAFTKGQALDTIRDIVLIPKNRAVTWNDFLSCSQKPGEEIDAYFTRCMHLSTEAEFMCPSCNHNLSAYLTLGKLITGLRDNSLKKEAYRACELFTINSLR